MKIIPDQTGTGAWQRAVICDAAGNPLDQGCGAALLVESADIFARVLPPPKASGAPGWTHLSFNMQCPRCGAWTGLPEESVRPEVRWEAQKRKAPVPQQYFRADSPPRGAADCVNFRSAA